MGKLCLTFWADKFLYVLGMITLYMYVYIIIKRMNLPNHLIMTLLHFYFLINPWFSNSVYARFFHILLFQDTSVYIFLLL